MSYKPDDSLVLYDERGYRLRMYLDHVFARVPVRVVPPCWLCSGSGEVRDGFRPGAFLCRACQGTGREQIPRPGFA